MRVINVGQNCYYLNQYILIKKKLRYKKLLYGLTDPLFGSRGVQHIVLRHVEHTAELGGTTHKKLYPSQINFFLVPFRDPMTQIDLPK